MVKSDHKPEETLSNSRIQEKKAAWDPKNTDLIKEPAYKELLVHYQKGEWSDCQRIINQLLIKYPHATTLNEMNSDINVKMMLQRMSAGEAREKKNKGIRTGIILILLIALTIFGVSYVIISSYQQKVQAVQKEIDQVNQQSLTQLQDQAMSSLEAGKPDIALGILDKIEQIDPKNPLLKDMRIKAFELQQIAALYDQGVESARQGNYDYALQLFNQVKQADPDFRDVNFQINQMGTEIKITGLIQTGENAYNQQHWEDAIAAYEEVRKLRPTEINDQIIDQMVFSYLNSIVETLSKNNQTIEELERSVRYYTKAISLIPQNRNFMSEREDLQKLSIELLISKNIQMARSILADPNHSEYNVAKAVAFLTNASQLNPQMTSYKVDIENANKYLSSLKAFDDEKWDLAISGFEDLAKFNGSYPNSLVKVRLYESYIAKGDKLFRGGFYMDARISYENAEMIAWQDPENAMRLFSVQMRLGDTIGRIGDYKNSLSYYMYAFNAIKAKSKLNKDSTLLLSIQTAETLNSSGKFDEGYTVIQGSINKINELYELQTVEARSGDNLVYLADKYHSTLTAILQSNKVAFPVIISTQQLVIPYLPVEIVSN